MSWNNQNLKKNISLFKVYSFFREIDFTRAIFIVYLLGLGVSNFEIGILQTVLFLSIVIFEIPSGMLADKFKRKWVLASGSLLMSLSFCLFYFAQNNFPLLLVAFVLIGLSFALNSGSDSALLYDGLVEVKEEEKHLEYMGSMRSLSTIALCLSVGLGGWILQLNASSIFLLTALAALISFVIIVKIPESQRAKSENITQTYKEFFQSEAGKKLFKFILLISLIEMIYTPVFIFSQSLFKEQGLSMTTISIIIAVSFLIEAWCFRYVVHLEKYKTSSVILLTLSIMLFSLSGIYLLNNIYATIILFLVYNVAPAMLFAKTDDYIQTKCHEEIRASLTSTQSLVRSLGISLGYLVFGYGFDNFGGSTTFALVAFSVLPIAVGFKFYFANEELK